MRHAERALEVLVIVLIGAAGLCVAIGVYESSSHHSGALWWALAAGAFIAAVLVPVLYFGVHPLFIWGREHTARWRERTAQLAAQERTRHRGDATAAGDDPAVVTVLYASYGGPTGDADVADIVRTLRSADGRFSFTVTNQVMGGGDPAFDPDPGEVKTLTMTYRHRGNEQTVRIQEGQDVTLP